MTFLSQILTIEILPAQERTRDNDESEAMTMNQAREAGRVKAGIYLRIRDKVTAAPLSISVTDGRQAVRNHCSIGV